VAGEALVEREDADDSSVRRTQVTIRGEGAPLTDSLFNEDDDAVEQRGPEWCVDNGETLVAMNKFALWLALGAGDVSPTMRVWKVGRERWQPASEIPDLACAVRLHGQTLLAAAKISTRPPANDRDSANDDDSADAETPLSPTSLAVPCASDPPATPDLSHTVFTEGAESDRPTEPEYRVRSVVGRPRRPSRMWGVAALAAVFAVALFARTAETRSAVFARALAANAADLIPIPALPETAEPTAPQEMTPAVATEPATPPDVEPAVTIQPTHPQKSVSPTHRGQTRAQRKGR